MLRLSAIPSLSTLLELNSNLQAICWDMDGTLLNTETLHEKAISLFISDDQSRDGLQEVALDISKFKGQTDSFVFEHLTREGFIRNCSEEEFLDVKDSLFFKAVDKVSDKELLHPNILSLLEEIQKNKIPMALVTSSEKLVTDILLKKLTLTHFFETIITREMTSTNKPLPEPYLKAMDFLDVEAETCLIIEDSSVGVQAAKAAKVQSIIHANWY